MPSEIAQPPPPPGLWTRAIAADTGALRELCATYWYPVYAWFRASGSTADQATIRTGDFLARLQTAPQPPADDPQAARLRDYLLARLEDFAVEGYPASDLPAIAIDLEKAEARFAKEPAKPAEMVFSRRWSLTLLSAAVERLRQEGAAAGKTELYQAMQPFLGFAGGGEERYAELAPKLGMSLSALKVEVYRYRQRFREILRELVADTVRDDTDVDSELTGLLCAVT